MANSATGSQAQCNWCWIPGWSFSGSVFEELFTELPGNHWVADYQTDTLSLAEMCALLSSQLPPQAIIIGWSLGGVLASKIDALTSAKNRPQAVVTLATGQKFVMDKCEQNLTAKQASQTGMSPEVFQAFTLGLTAQPEKTLKRFIGLCAQNADNTRAVMRTLSEHQHNPSKELEHTLNWLADYQLPDGGLNQSTQDFSANWYAQQDALNPMRIEPAQQSSAASHAFFITPAGKTEFVAWLKKLETTLEISYDNA